MRPNPHDFFSKANWHPFHWFGKLIWPPSCHVQLEIFLDPPPTPPDWFVLLRLLSTCLTKILPMGLVYLPGWVTLLVSDIIIYVFTIIYNWVLWIYCDSVSSVNRVQSRRLWVWFLGPNQYSGSYERYSLYTARGWAFAWLRWPCKNTGPIPISSWRCKNIVPN